MASGDRIARFAVVGLAATALAAGSAIAVSSGGGDGPSTASSAPTSRGTAVTAAKKPVLRGPRGKRGRRGVRGLRGLPGATGPTGLAGPIGPSEALAVRDSSGSPFPQITGGMEETAVSIAALQVPAGAWVIQAKNGMNGTGTGGRVVCRLVAGAVVLDQSILTSGNGAGSVGQADMRMMSATTFPAPTLVQVLCHQEGGSTTPFASQQQILALRVGSATTTAVTF